MGLLRVIKFNRSYVCLKIVKFVVEASLIYLWQYELFCMASKTHSLNKYHTLHSKRFQVTPRHIHLRHKEKQKSLTKKILSYNNSGKFLAKKGSVFLMKSKTNNNCSCFHIQLGCLFVEGMYSLGIAGISTLVFVMLCEKQLWNGGKVSWLVWDTLCRW